MPLKRAIGEILQVCDDGENTQGRRPHFFLIGAGISYPSIPIASTIETECKAIAQKLDRTAEAPGKRPIDTYSHWFNEAFPSPKGRQTYLRKLIEGRNISHANLRLAHLLSAKKVANLVVTPNFDDFLSRALTLFGIPHIVCDHPATVERINPEQNDLQIVHVHGTYWFYDCCNLRGEIENRARPSAKTTLTMASKLDDIFSRSSPLVIGYGGWDGDVIMAALQRRLEYPLPYNLYWFCYQRANIDSLPTWLKDHPNVVFVVPDPTPAASRDSQKISQQSQTEVQFEATPYAEVKAPVKDSVEPTLPAHTVIDEINKAFNVPTPKLTSDPLGFFAEHLHRSLPQDETGVTGREIYFFSNVIERVNRAQSLEAKWQQDDARRIVSQMEALRDAVRRSQYREAINKALEISLDDMTPTQLGEFMDSLWSSTQGLFDNSQEELKAYDLIVTAGDELIRQKRTRETSVEKSISTALLYKALVLEAQGRGDEEIEVYDQLIERLRNSGNADVPWVLLGKGTALTGLNRNEQAMSVYDQILKEFDIPSYQDVVALALSNKGTGLGVLNRSEDAIAVYDEIVARYGNSSEISLTQEVARALFNKGARLAVLNRSEEAIAVYDDVVARFGDSTEISLRQQVAKSLVNKAARLNALNRKEEAIAVYDDVITRFGDAEDASLREATAKSLVNKAAIVASLSKYQEAIDGANQAVIRFGDATEPELQKQVARAYNGIGFTMMCQAKKHIGSGEDQRATELLLIAQEKLAHALQLKPKDPTIIGNQGYTAFLLGNRDVARQLLTEAISIGGEKLRTTELKDADIHSLPLDEEFRDLVRSIPAQNSQLQSQPEV